MAKQEKKMKEIRVHDKVERTSADNRNAWHIMNRASRLSIGAAPPAMDRSPAATSS